MTGVTPEGIITDVAGPGGGAVIKPHPTEAVPMTAPMPTGPEQGSVTDSLSASGEELPFIETPLPTMPAPPVEGEAAPAEHTQEQAEPHHEPTPPFSDGEQPPHQESTEAVPEQQVVYQDGETHDGDAAAQMPSNEDSTHVEGDQPVEQQAGGEEQSADAQPQEQDGGESPQVEGEQPTATEHEEEQLGETAIDGLVDDGSAEQAEQNQTPENDANVTPVPDTAIQNYDKAEDEARAADKVFDNYTERFGDETNTPADAEFLGRDRQEAMDDGAELAGNRYELQHLAQEKGISVDELTKWMTEDSAALLHYGDAIIQHQMEHHEKLTVGQEAFTAISGWLRSHFPDRQPPDLFDHFDNNNFEEGGISGGLKPTSAITGKIGFSVSHRRSDIISEEWTAAPQKGGPWSYQGSYTIRSKGKSEGFDKVVTESSRHLTEADVERLKHVLDSFVPANSEASQHSE
jgi:hypothetical protein